MKHLTPKQLVERIRNRMDGQTMSFSQIERTLDLPYDYFKQLELKSINDAAPEDLALLRVLVTIPWVIHVAANGYEDANKILYDNIVVRPEIELQKRIIEKGW